MSTNFIKKILVVAITMGFVSTAFAGWNWNTNRTNCWGGYCKHTVVQKHCSGGQCWTSRHYNTWHR